MRTLLIAVYVAGAYGFGMTYEADGRPIKHAIMTVLWPSTAAMTAGIVLAAILDRGRAEGIKSMEGPRCRML